MKDMQAVPNTQLKFLSTFYPGLIPIMLHLTKVETALERCALLLLKLPREPVVKLKIVMCKLAPIMLFIIKNF